jgi:hypothetical protein
MFFFYKTGRTLCMSPFIRNTQFVASIVNLIKLQSILTTVVLDDCLPLTALWTHSNTAAAAVVRAKPAHLRSVSEKHWTALDRLINPELYIAISDVDAEEMSLDDDYR